MNDLTVVFILKLRPFRFPTERVACHDASPGRRPLMRDVIAAD